jgi:hypothetical protein
MLKLRHEAGDSADHYQVYSGTVRVGTIYRTHSRPGGKSFRRNGPGCPNVAMSLYSATRSSEGLL